MAAPLFGDVGAKRKPAKKAEADGVVVRLEAAYRAEFRRKWNACAAHRRADCRRCGPEWALLDVGAETRPYFNFSRDRKLLKNLAAAWDETTVVRLISDFFASSDPQITNRDYQVPVFFQQAQRLLLDAQRLDRRTAENIDAAARAIRRK